MDQTYCLGCKTKTSDINPKIEQSGKRKRLSSNCSSCGGNKSKFISSTNGKGFNDGNTKWGMGCMKNKTIRGGSVVGQGLIYPSPIDRYYTDDMHEFKNQDLFEYQDDITNRRVNYMMALYRKNNPLELDLENVALETDAMHTDPNGNLLFDDMGNPILNIDDAQADENIINQLPQMQEQEIVEGRGMHKPRGGYIQPIMPIKRQTMEYANPNERRQYESEKWIQPQKNISERPEHLRQMLSMEDMSMYGNNRKSQGGDLFMKVGLNNISEDTYNRWMERNGYKLNEDSYNDYVIKTRQKIYLNSDINNIESNNYPQSEERFYVEPKQMFEKDSYIQKSFGLPNPVPKFSKYGQLKFKKVVNKQDEQNKRMDEQRNREELDRQFRIDENNDLLEQDLTYEEEEEQQFNEEQDQGQDQGQDQEV